MARGYNRSSAVNHATQTLSYSAYLVFDGRGNMKLTRGVPSLEPGEVSCALSLKVPLKLFSRPSIKAVIEIPESAGVVDASAHAVLDLKKALQACPNIELTIGSKGRAKKEARV